MKTKNINVKEKDSWALPGKPISLDEFKEGIKKAEKGPFMTLKEVKKSVEEWKRSQNL